MILLTPLLSVRFYLDRCKLQGMVPCNDKLEEPLAGSLYFEMGGSHWTELCKLRRHSQKAGFRTHAA